MATVIRISKRKLAHPVQAPPNLGYATPEQEAEARKPRYLHFCIDDLLDQPAYGPVNLWSSTPPPKQAVVARKTPPKGDNVPDLEMDGDSSLSSANNSSESSSLSSSSQDGNTEGLASARKRKFDELLSRIETRNDRCTRGKLAESQISPDDCATSSPPAHSSKKTAPTARKIKAIKLTRAKGTSAPTGPPPTPSSQLPRNTASTDHLPDYVPPGRRGSRVAINMYDSADISTRSSAPAPILRRTQSSSSTTTITVVLPATNTRRAAAAPRQRAITTGSERQIHSLASSSILPPTALAAPAPEPRRASPPTTIKIPAQKRRSPLQSPALSSASASASASLAGSAASLPKTASEPPSESDEDYEDEDDGNYKPPTSHKKKSGKKSPATGFAKKSYVAVAATASPVVGTFTESNRPSSRTVEIASAVTSIEQASSASEQQQAIRRIKISRPTALTLTKSNLASTIPRTHSPLSQSFVGPREDATVRTPVLAVS